MNMHCYEYALPFSSARIPTIHVIVILQVVRKLRRLPWSENETYLIRSLLSASVGRYSSAPLLASLTAGLSRYHPSLRIGVIDSLLEEVRPLSLIPHRFPDSAYFLLLAACWIAAHVQMLVMHGVYIGGLNLLACAPG